MARTKKIGRYTRSSSPFLKMKIELKGYNRGRRRLDQSSLKRFLIDDSMGSSFSSDSSEIWFVFGSIVLKVESESSLLVKVRSSCT